MNYVVLIILRPNIRKNHFWNLANADNLEEITSWYTYVGFTSCIGYGSKILIKTSLYVFILACLMASACVKYDSMTFSHYNLPKSKCKYTNLIRNKNINETFVVSR